MKANFLKDEDRQVFEEMIKKRLVTLNKEVEHYKNDALRSDEVAEQHTRRASKSRTLALVYTLEQDALRAQLSEPIKGGGVDHY
jgi:hypothetical protein